MNINTIRSSIGRHVINILGRRINRKVVVFESDDWGSIRMPSKDVFKSLNKLGLLNDANPFNKYDTLETANDLTALFEVLIKYRDKNGNHPIITTNFVTANPCFEKIFHAKYKGYHYELITETYKRSKKTFGSFALILEGLRNGLIKPQYHGREHLNVDQWMGMLKVREPGYITAFNNGVFCIDSEKITAKRKNLMASFDFESLEQKEKIKNIITEGYEQFRTLFGFSSDSIIPPCNIWHPDHEVTFNNLGIKYIQGLIVQLIPQINSVKYKKTFHYQGQYNHKGQIYLVRNAFFEPSTIENYDWVGQCLLRCKTAFLYGKPAIISMHRVNLMGGIYESNRKKNLKLLDELLTRILSTWSDIEFMSSDELGLLMLQD